MITDSGVQMHPACGRAPTPRDIAVGMCRITRYAGAVWCPLALHSILVAEFALRSSGISDTRWAMGLLHDAHETVTGEVTRHYKPKEMKPYEHELDAAIFKSFGLDVEAYRKEHAFFKEMDEKALCVEALALGLKDWPAYYQAREGKPIPVLTESERVVGRVVIHSIWREPDMVRDRSEQIEILANALRLVSLDKLSEARRMISIPEYVGPMAWQDVPKGLPEEILRERKS